MRGTPEEPFEIVLVEDNPADADLVSEALQEAAEVPVRLTVLSDGEEALEYLRGHGGQHVPRPDLVLMDLNLPRKDGRELLAEIRSDPLLTQLPVVVLTSSEAERDLTRAYGLHANAVVSKPLDLGRFFEVIRDIEHFWLLVARLPPRPAAAAP